MRKLPQFKNLFKNFPANGWSASGGKRRKRQGHLLRALKTVFLKDPFYLPLAGIASLALLGIYLFIFFRSTTFPVFFLSNTDFYNYASVLLTLVIGILFGIALAMLVYVLRHRMPNQIAVAGNGFAGTVLGALAAGCPVCGAWLLPLLGIAGSLAAFPLQGLEIKIPSIFLLLFSINESARAIAGLCPVVKRKLLVYKNGYLTFRFDWEALAPYKSLGLAILAVLIIYALPSLPSQLKFNFARGAQNGGPYTSSGAEELLAQINPAEGYTINASFGDLGPQIIASGAVDLEKFKEIYASSSTPLTDEQLKILTEGLDKKITIDSNNSYFLLNFFWALGLANKNPLLTQGPIAQYGEGQIGSFASTGGWTIAQKNLEDFYSKSELVKLTSDQQARLEEVAGNAYRPCCGNPTSFPDCNHGMALLAVLELLTSNDATEGEMYEAAKYFNVFWFPQQYLDIASYFKAKEGKSFAEADAKRVVSNEFSSAQGWSQTYQWLADNNLREQIGGGGGCGV